MRIIIPFLRINSLVACGEAVAGWWASYRVRVYRYVGRAVGGVTVLFALGCSVWFMVAVFDAEEQALANRSLPVPEGYCRKPHLTSYLFFAYLNAAFRSESADFQLLEYFVNCEARKEGRAAIDRGMYVAFGAPEALSASETAALLDDHRSRLRQRERLSPARGFGKVLALEGKQHHVSFGLLREEAQALYTGGLERVGSLSEATWIEADVQAFVAARGKVIGLVMVRPYETEATIDELLDDARGLVRRLLTPEGT
jgi:hypothetical protein